MKKIISLIASIAMLASMVTSVSAAELANNNPVLVTTVEEVDSAFIANYNLTGLADGQKGYLITVDVTGVDLSVVRAGTDANGKKARIGVMIKEGQYDLIEAEGMENIVEAYTDDDGAYAGSGNFTLSLMATSPTECWPQQLNNNSAAAIEEEESHINNIIVVTNGKPVSGTIEASITIADAVYDVNAATKNYFPGGEQIKRWNTWTDTLPCTVNGVEGKTVTLPGGEEAKPIEITKAYGDVGEGFAWDVTVNNYDANKKYTATFTDETATDDALKTKVHDFDFSKYIEAGGSTTRFSFVTLLKTAKTNVTLAVSAK